MPTITINYEDLIKLIGKEIPLDELEEIILLLKGEVEEVEGKEITIEVTADRIDLLSTEGWVRAIKGFLEIETGIPEYPILPATTHLKVDSSVLKVRPYIVAAIVRGVNLSEDALIQSLQLQEKLHMTWCRNRKKASIGIYDLDKIKPPITYLALPPEKIRFVPLDTKEEMNGREILEKHPKGIEFAHLLQGAPEYPLLIDSEGTVLSMPPIINSEDTRVTEDTKNLFIDVTGLSEDVINYALNTIVANLAERGGKKIELRMLASTEEAKPRVFHHPWDVSLNEKLDVLFSLNKIERNYDKRIVNATSYYHEGIDHFELANSFGSYIVWDEVRTRLASFVVASESGKMQKSYSVSYTHLTLPTTERV